MCMFGSRSRFVCVALTRVPCVGHMAPLHMRSVLLSAVREEMRDHRFLQETWSVWRLLVRARLRVATSAVENDAISMAAFVTRRSVYTVVVQKQAHAELAEFVTMHGGSVSTTVLARLYQSSPWLADAVGGLREFCAKSAVLQYTPRVGACRPMVSISAHQTTGTDCDAYMQAGSEHHDEFYTPHWKSRVNLNAQRRRGPRELPKGFHPRKRTEKRANGRAWLDSFLACFCPNIHQEVDVLIKATRRWPPCDENESGSISGAVHDQASVGIGRTHCRIIGVGETSVIADGGRVGLEPSIGADFSDQNPSCWPRSANPSEVCQRNLFLQTMKPAQGLFSESLVAAAFYVWADLFSESPCQCKHESMLQINVIGITNGLFSESLSVATSSIRPDLFSESPNLRLGALLKCKSPWQTVEKTEGLFSESLFVTTFAPALSSIARSLFGKAFVVRPDLFSESPRPRLGFAIFDELCQHQPIPLTVAATEGLFSESLHLVVGKTTRVKPFNVAIRGAQHRAGSFQRKSLLSGFAAKLVQRIAAFRESLARPVRASVKSMPGSECVLFFFSIPGASS